MVICNQRKCAHVAQELSLGGTLVCTLPDVMMTRIESGRSFILNCSGYRRRPEWNGNFPDHGIPSTSPQEGEDGLYPGQIKPQPDYSDVDPDEETEADCDT